MQAMQEKARSCSNLIARIGASCCQDDGASFFNIVVASAYRFLPKSGRRPLASAKGMDGAGSQQRQDVPLRLTEDNRCARIHEDSEDEQGARDADLRIQARWVEGAIRRHRGSHPHHPVHSQYVPAPLDGCTRRLQE